MPQGVSPEAHWGVGHLPFSQVFSQQVWSVAHQLLGETQLGLSEHWFLPGSKQEPEQQEVPQGVSPEAHWGKVGQSSLGFTKQLSAVCPQQQVVSLLQETDSVFAEQ